MLKKFKLIQMEPSVSLGIAIINKFIFVVVS